MNKALALSTTINLEEQARILKYIKKHPSREGKKAKNAYILSVIITLLIIFLVMIPLCIYNFKKIDNIANSKDFPSGATKEVSGHISLYEDTFWYTDSSNKYEFNLNEYTLDSSFEKGEIIRIYLDDNNNVISIAHEQDEGKEIVVSTLIMFVIPISLLLIHAFVGRKTYSKYWYLYVQWYKKEIEPYLFSKNYEEIINNKKYYDVTVKVRDLKPEVKSKYKSTLSKYIILNILFLVFICIIIYFAIKFNIEVNNGLFIIGLSIVILIFYILINICEENLEQIKNGAENKNEKNKSI